MPRNFPTLLAAPKNYACFPSTPLLQLPIRSQNLMRESEARRAPWFANQQLLIDPPAIILLNRRSDILVGSAANTCSIRVGLEVEGKTRNGGDGRSSSDAEGLPVLAVVLVEVSPVCNLALSFFAVLKCVVSLVCASRQGMGELETNRNSFATRARSQGRFVSWFRTVEASYLCILLRCFVRIG